MAMMGFTRDPGPLPFVTIRDAKWANRLTNAPMMIRIHGEHGCPMPRGMALVVKVEPYTGESPEHLAQRYNGVPLVAVHLEKPPPCRGRHMWDNEWGMCAACGEPIPPKEATTC